MAVLNNPAGNLIESAVAAATGNSINARHAANYAYLHMATLAASSIITLQVSHDDETWMIHSVYTAEAAGTTAQINGYMPYVRAILTTRYVGATATVAYAPGLT